MNVDGTSSRHVLRVTGRSGLVLKQRVLLPGRETVSPGSSWRHIEMALPNASVVISYRSNPSLQSAYGRGGICSFLTGHRDINQLRNGNKAHDARDTAPLRITRGATWHVGRRGLVRTLDAFTTRERAHTPRGITDTKTPPIAAFRQKEETEIAVSPARW